MNRTLHIGSAMLLVVGAGFGADQKAPKEPPPKASPAAATAPAPKGGVPKAGLPKGAARLVNPANPLVRLFRMTPEQRELAIERAGPKQQEQARKLLAWFDALPKDQQELQVRRAEKFAQLPAEKQTEIKQLLKAANDLPPARKRAVGAALVRLQEMPDQQRENTLRRPIFQARFSPDELKIITGLADTWMGGPPQ